MTSQIGRGVAIIAVAALVGILILSNGYDDPDNVAVGVVTVDPAVSDDGGDDDPVADDGGSDDAPADDPVADDSGVTDDGAADDGTSDVVVDDGTATDVAGDDSAAAPVRPPADVKVLVANGSGIDGAAGRGRDALTVQAYTVLGAVNATVTGVDVVYYQPGFQAEAVVIAEVLGSTADIVEPMPDFPPVLDLLGADVLVILGPQLASAT